MTLSIIIYDTVYVSLSSAFGVRLYNIYCHKAMMDCQPPRGAVWGQHVADAKRRELFSLLIIVSSNHVHIYCIINFTGLLYCTCIRCDNT